MKDKFKICKCIFCGSNFEGKINLQKRFYVCPDCKTKGLKPIVEKKYKSHICNICGNQFSGSIYLQTKFCVCEKCRSENKKCSYDKETTEKINKKREKSNIKKYGVRNVLQNEEIKNKVMDTCLKKYGSKSSLGNKDVRNKVKKTILKKYNVEHITQNAEIKAKLKKTMDERYNGAPIKDKGIRKKIEETNLKKYGVVNPFSSKIIQDKIKQTNLKKYGSTNPMGSPAVKNKVLKTKSINFSKKYDEFLNNTDNESIDFYYDKLSTKGLIYCKKCGGVFQDTLFNVKQRININSYVCPLCGKLGHRNSNLEKEIIDFTAKILGKNNIIIGNRIILKPKELDIYIPSKNIAIEFDGLYWHSEAVLKDKNYHLNKTLKCEKQGIQLVHIFEDEWFHKQDIVKARLKQILGINNSKRIHARKCEVKEIDPKTKNKFLEKYHIQGKDKSTIKLGAFYNNELVSVMTFSHGNISKGSKSIADIWELNRFCSNSNYRIPGIASKLLTYFKRNYEWKEIFSYADRRWSNGNVYEKLGFELSHMTKTNYWYVNFNTVERFHRFIFRKKKDEPKDIPEWTLRRKQGLYRIWDCGSLKYIMKKLG